MKFPASAQGRIESNKLTLGRVNGADPKKFLLQLYNARLSFIRDIIKKHPEQKKFERGWIRRLNDFI